MTTADDRETLLRAAQILERNVGAGRSPLDICTCTHDRRAHDDSICHGSGCECSAFILDRDGAHRGDRGIAMSVLRSEAALLTNEDVATERDALADPAARQLAASREHLRRWATDIVDGGREPDPVEDDAAELWQTFNTFAALYLELTEDR